MEHTHPGGTQIEMGGRGEHEHTDLLMHMHIHAALSCIHMSCLHSVQAVGHGFLHRGHFQLFLYVHIHTMFSSFNNLASVLSHRVCLSPPLSCFCTEHCECVPRGLLLYRRPVTLIDFTLSHFLSLAVIPSLTLILICCPLRA